MEVRSPTMRAVAVDNVAVTSQQSVDVSQKEKSIKPDFSDKVSISNEALERLKSDEKGDGNSATVMNGGGTEPPPIRPA